LAHILIPLFEKQVLEIQLVVTWFTLHTSYAATIIKIWDESIAGNLISHVFWGHIARKFATGRQKTSLQI